MKALVTTLALVLLGCSQNTDTAKITEAARAACKDHGGATRIYDREIVTEYSCVAKCSVVLNPQVWERVSVECMDQTQHTVKVQEVK